MLRDTSERAACDKMADIHWPASSVDKRSSLYCGYLWLLQSHEDTGEDCEWL